MLSSDCAKNCARASSAHEANPHPHHGTSTTSVSVSSRRGEDVCKPYGKRLRHLRCHSWISENMGASRRTASACMPSPDQLFFSVFEARHSPVRLTVSLSIGVREKKLPLCAAPKASCMGRAQAQDVGNNDDEFPTRCHRENRGECPVPSIFV